VYWGGEKFVRVQTRGGGCPDAKDLLSFGKKSQLGSTGGSNEPKGGWGGLAAGGKKKTIEPNGKEAKGSELDW